MAERNDFSALSFRLGAVASRVKSRIDAIIERDGTKEKAVVGPGVGIGYLFARDIHDALADGSEALERFHWRPISEIHEDFGECVLININDPGDMALGSNTSLDFDAKLWTHFTRITPLTHVEAVRMKEEIGSVR